MSTQILSSNLWSSPSRTVKVYYDVSARTLNTVKIKLTFSYILNSSDGYSGYAAYVTPTIAGVAKSKITMKSSTPSSWYGNPISVSSETYTVSGLSWNTKGVAISCLFSTADPEDSNKRLTATVPIAQYDASSVLGTINDFAFDSTYGVGVSISVPVTRYIPSFHDKLIVKYEDNLIAERRDFASTTLELSQNEIIHAYSLMENVNSCTWDFYLTTHSTSSMDDSDKIGVVSKKSPIASISDNGRKPTFSSSNLSGKDINPVTTLITGNNQKIIKGYSTLSVTLTAAIANKGAKIASYSSYSVACGGISKEVNSAYNVSFENVASNQYTVAVTDSRKNTSTALGEIKAENWINYTPPAFNRNEVIVKRVLPDNTGETISIAIKGSYFNWSSLAQNNGIKTLKYRFRPANGNFGEYINISSDHFTSQNGVFEYPATNQSGTFSIDTAYEFEFVAFDLLASNSSPFKVDLQSAQPTLDLDVENNTLGVGELFSGEAASHSASFKKGIKLGSPLSVSSGGTGATTAAAARTNLGMSHFQTFYFAAAQAQYLTLQENWSSIPNQTCFFAWVQNTKGSQQAFWGMKANNDYGCFFRMGYDGMPLGAFGAYRLYAGTWIAEGGAKQLWNGSWSSGTITMQNGNLSDYSIYKVIIANNVGKSFIGCLEDGELLLNDMVYYNDYHYSRSIIATANLTNNSLTLTKASELRHNPSGSHGALGTKTISQIWGIR